MKKCLFLIAMMCFLGISVLNAQLSQGKTIIGISSSSRFLSLYEAYSGGSSNLINLGFSSIKYKSDSYEGDSEKFRTFNLSPRIGYFIGNNLAGGFDINFSLISYGDGDNKVSNTVLGVGPFIRYYLSAEKVVPFVELGGSFGILRHKYSWNNTDEIDKSGIRSFAGGIGLAIPVSQTVKFDIMGGYVSTRMKDNEENPDNTRSILNTIGFKFGFLIFLGANK